uniref:Uncharacterized protein n=1 Tax=Staphylococcus aureus TaxID=1280 RepID=Q9LBY4_STAAU|nr:hypothetical protein [Staphylococcus aureus]
MLFVLQHFYPAETYHLSLTILDSKISICLLLPDEKDIPNNIHPLFLLLYSHHILKSKELYYSSQ